MDQIKETWMWEIFDLIDDDEDGYISPQHIDITTLPNNIIDIITPVLLEIEQEQLTLDHEKFCELLEDLISTLTVEERNILVGPKW